MTIISDQSVIYQGDLLLKLAYIVQNGRIYVKETDRQTEMSIYINMLANSILILNKCNVYWIANESKKKYSKSDCLFTYFVALSVGLQRGSMARS